MTVNAAHVLGRRRAAARIAAGLPRRPRPARRARLALSRLPPRRRRRRGGREGGRARRGGARPSVMPTRKQRRRRRRTSGTSTSTSRCTTTETGEEVEVEPDELEEPKPKRQPKAAAKAQATKQSMWSRKGRVVQPPSWERVLRRGAMMRAVHVRRVSCLRQEHSRTSRLSSWRRSCCSRSSSVHATGSTASRTAPTCGAAAAPSRSQRQSRRDARGRASRRGSGPRRATARAAGPCARRRRSGARGVRPGRSGRASRRLPRPNRRLPSIVTVPSTTVTQAFSFTWCSPSACPGLRTISTARASLPDWMTIGSRVPSGASISIRSQCCTRAILPPPSRLNRPCRSSSTAIVLGPVPIELLRRPRASAARPTPP